MLELFIEAFKIMRATDFDQRINDGAMLQYGNVYWSGNMAKFRKYVKLP